MRVLGHYIVFRSILGGRMPLHWKLDSQIFIAHNWPDCSLSLTVGTLLFAKRYGLSNVGNHSRSRATGKRVTFLPLLQHSPGLPTGARSWW